MCAYSVLNHFVCCSVLNGVVLVLKMERFRQDLEGELVNYMKMFKTFKLPKSAFIVVITHSLQYTEAIKSQYSQWIAERFSEMVRRENILHMNFILLDEVNEDFGMLYAKQAKDQQDAFKNHINQRFANEYNIRHWFDKKMGLDKEIGAIFRCDALGAAAFLFKDWG